LPGKGKPRETIRKKRFKIKGILGNCVLASSSIQIDKEGYQVLKRRKKGKFYGFRAARSDTGIETRCGGGMITDWEEGKKEQRQTERNH